MWHFCYNGKPLIISYAEPLINCDSNVGCYIIEYRLLWNCCVQQLMTCYEIMQRSLDTYGIKVGKTGERSLKSDGKALEVHPPGEFFCGRRAIITAGILLLLSCN